MKTKDNININTDNVLYSEKEAFGTGFSYVFYFIGGTNIRLAQTPEAQTLHGKIKIGKEK